jgi:flagellar hook-length control protein FliK
MRPDNATLQSLASPIATQPVPTSLLNSSEDRNITRSGERFRDALDAQKRAADDDRRDARHVQAQAGEASRQQEVTQQNAAQNARLQQHIADTTAWQAQEARARSAQQQTQQSADARATSDQLQDRAAQTDAAVAKDAAQTQQADTSQAAAAAGAAAVQQQSAAQTTAKAAESSDASADDSRAALSATGAAAGAAGTAASGSDGTTAATNGPALADPGSGQSAATADASTQSQADSGTGANSGSAAGTDAANSAVLTSTAGTSPTNGASNGDAAGKFTLGNAFGAAGATQTASGSTTDTATAATKGLAGADGAKSRDDKLFAALTGRGAVDNAGGTDATQAQQAQGASADPSAMNAQANAMPDPSTAAAAAANQTPQGPLQNQAQQQVAAQQAPAFVPQQLDTPFVDARWADAFNQNIMTMSRPGNEQRAELTLNPPDLGPVQVVLNVVGSDAQATFVSQHAHVREAIEAAMPALRERFADSGMQLQTNVAQTNGDAQAMANSLANAGSGGAQNSGQRGSDRPAFGETGRIGGASPRGTVAGAWGNGAGATNNTTRSNGTLSGVDMFA